MYEKDSVLNDLKQFVIEFTFFKNDDPSQRFSIRGTLKEKYLPPSYKNEKTLIEDFQKQKSDVIAIFNLKMGQWSLVNVNDIKYLQIIDGY